MMVAYVAVPSRLAGIKSDRSRRDKLTAAAVGGAIGATVCSPPYALGRVAILMLGIHYLRIPAIILLAVAVVLQTGATTATKAVKFSAKLVTRQGSDSGDAKTPSDRTYRGGGGGRSTGHPTDLFRIHLISSPRGWPEPTTHGGDRRGSRSR